MSTSSEADKMKPGKVICTIRDAIKQVDFPGNKRVARKGSHILFDVGDETYSCAIKRVSKNTGDRNSPMHVPDDQVVFESENK